MHKSLIIFSIALFFNSAIAYAGLIASYNFDDDWEINANLTDQTGSYNGSPSGSVSRVLASASGLKGDTCYAGSFSGGDIDISGLPISTSTGATTSVSFWMYWDGTDNVMPMGWYKHDLWLVSSFFGFNSWNNDLTGISSSGLSSGWHHVAAVFTNGNISNNKLYIDGVLKPISSVGNSAYSSNAYVQSALRMGGVIYSSSFRFKGKLDNFKVYNGTITQAQVTADMNESNACPVQSATLIASYNFDDDWETNNSLSDQTGSYNGTPSGSLSQVDSGASGLKGDTCYAGSFSGGNIDISGLPVSTTYGAKTSVSFWMYWDGTDHIMPMGWNVHDLYLSSGYFGFNTGHSDITGILSSGLSSGWHHVAAVFTNGSISNNKLYIDGVLKSISTVGYAPILSNAYVQSTLLIGGWTHSSLYRFKGKLDNFKVYNGTITQAQVTTDMNESNACPVQSATLIASYNFDDDWVTNNSLTDQTASYDGSPSGSVSQVSAGASGSKGDTCYAGSFNGGAIDISGLPVSTSTGAKTSVSFWMYWDGTNHIMPMGWNIHDLFLSSGYFGFNTFHGDITGISSSGLSSGWHHVAAVFTNGSVSNNKLYIDGVLKPISPVGNTPILSNAYVQSALQIGGWTHSSTYRFKGKLDNFKIYNGTITQTQVTSDMNESNACPSVDTPAVAFNCVENGSDGITGKLYTKTTAQSFSFDIVALRASSTLETSFADGADHTVTVELVDNSSGGACSAYTALSPAVSQSLLFTSSDAGKKATATMNSDTAYRSVACRVTDTTDSPSIVGCSTDSFSIRPTDFTLTSNLTYTDPFSTPIVKAGDNFTLTATTTTEYTGTPKIDTSKLQAHSGAIQTGTITGSFNAAVAGIATGTSFIYTEVGTLRFTAEGIYDDTFTSIDPSTECTDDFSNTVVSKKVGCKFGNPATSSYFGRFTPDHFDVSLNTPVFEPACNMFTYLGQPFKYATNPVVTFEAKNASGTTTQNYTGVDFWKINSASQTPTYTEATYGLTEINPSEAPSVTDNGDGTGVLTYADTSSNILALTKGALSTPYDAEIALSFTLADTDSIVVANVDGSAQTNPVKFGATTSGNGISFSGTYNTHRWGRVVLSNAYGSELTPLSIPITTQYYNGTSFIQNTNDSCTNFTLANDFSISDAADFNCTFSTQTSPVTIGSGSVKATLSNTTLTSGTTELLVSDNSNTTHGSGAGNTGYIEITSNLANLTWLKYDWDANSSDDNCPSARATFGIYKGNNKQIYFREIY